VTTGWVRHRVGDFELNTSWDVAPGSVTVLFGRSGAGKSMTLRAITGLLRPTEGHVEVGGRVVFDAGNGDWVPPHHRKVGYLPQDYGLFPHLSVFGNITYGLPKKGPDREIRLTRVREMIATLRLEGLETRRPDSLSGGQRQRTALARALASAPDVLLLDEPFAALDEDLRRTVRREIRQILLSSDVPVLLVTHDAEEALALADRVHIIDQGRSIATGEPFELIVQPAQERIARLTGVENILQMRVADIRPRDGTMICTDLADTVRLEIPATTVGKPGDEVTVGIRAGDVILAREEPKGLSARNLLAGSISAVEPRAPGFDVSLDCGSVRIVAHVTRNAIDDLDLRPGVPAWAVLKASSCYVLEGSSDR
jgi:molybdate transport system ATP-binding protein